VDQARRSRSGAPDLDGALDRYGGLVDLVRGKVWAAQGLKELNVVLASVIASIRTELVDGQLSATFRLHVPDGPDRGIAGTGFSLSPVDNAEADRTHGYFETPPDATTGRFTLVHRCPVTATSWAHAWPVLLLARGLATDRRVACASVLGRTQRLAYATD
jgi:hypothetical protein